MRTAQILLDGPAVGVAEVGCDASTARWSQPELVTSLSVVLVRCGLFRRRVDGVESVAGPVAGYLQRPGSIQQVAHTSRTCSVSCSCVAWTGGWSSSTGLHRQADPPEHPATPAQAARPVHRRAPT
ncbi:MAG TPA: hypothetical protein VFA46_22950 [Actinomycetes bacterium]|nr:hypothetical protein [Actinomycetes bacterium]